MRKTWLIGIASSVCVLGLIFSALPSAAVDKIVLGHPACLTGRYAKSGAQGSWGIKSSIKWINEVNRGITIGGKKVPFEYKPYDTESRKEGVTSLIDRLATVDKVDAIIATYSSGLTLTGAPVAEKHGKIYLSYMGASDRIFQQGYEYAICAISPGSDYQRGALEMLRNYDPRGKRLALVFEDSEFARMVLLGAAKKAQELGFSVPIMESGDFPPFSNPYRSSTSRDHVGIRWIMLDNFWLWWLQFSYSFSGEFDLSLTPLGRGGKFDAGLSGWVRLNISTANRSNQLPLKSFES